MKNIITLSILCVAILGFIIYFIFVKIVESDTVTKSLQPTERIASVKSTFPQLERTFSLSRELTDYDIIAENNIFRPLGWKRENLVPVTPAVAPEPIAETPPAPPPTYALILTGIVKDGADWIAIVEDRERNEGVFLRHGEPLKDVRVQDIMSEHITLTRDEMTVQLALGEIIEYGVDGRLRFDTAGIAKIPKPIDKTEISSETEPDSRDDDGEKSLLERMRERRRQELDR